MNLSRWPGRLALALLSATALAATPRAAWNPEHAELLFASSRDGNPEIFVRPAGAGAWRNLTNDPARDNWPVWSPDGARIAFQSTRGGGLDVWSMAADGSDLRRLTDHEEPDYLPAWSPDGRRIVFTSWRRETGDTARAPHLYLMNADGSGQRRLVARSLQTSSGATWSPDGRWLVYSRRESGEGADLWLAESSGRRERQLTRAGATYHGSPVFSPDGKWIAFYADDGKKSAIEIIRPNGRDHRVVRATGRNWYPRWSPDGRWLTATVAVGDSGDTDVAAVAVEGARDPVPLAASPRRESESSWKPSR